MTPALVHQMAVGQSKAMPLALSRGRRVLMAWRPVATTAVRAASPSAGGKPGAAQAASGAAGSQRCSSIQSRFR
ncbi:MAG: hypothetical protein ACR2F8_07725, partial [Caulobacteraceae bacterium]